MAAVEPRKRRGEKQKGFLLALPALLWLTFFFLLPVFIVLIVSFMSRGRGGVAELPLTLANYERVFDVFLIVIQNSLWIALVTTIICLVVGYPLAFFISTRQSSRARTFALFMIMLPFWTNFLVRTYAIQSILGREGILNTFFQSLSLITEPLRLLNTPEAVLVGLVYGFLPFMVLPIYASVERFDFRYVEAAHDLGANDIRAFLRVVFPMTLPGVVAGCILVFIPAIGAFVTPDLLGGTKGIMIGNLIQQQFRGSGNQPLGSALSIVLMALVMLALLIYIRFGDQEG
ncbi:MAG: ABC transporter permease [Anaerolineaceae bacterium]|nr:ABC transporter permease [Anaerolineaceae bacterium]